MKRVLIWGVVALLLAQSSRAAEIETMWEELGLDGLARAGSSYSGELELSTDLTLEQGMRVVTEQGAQQLPGVLHQAVRSALRLLVVVLVCAIADSARAAGVIQGMNAVLMAGALAITAVSAGEVSTMVGLGRTTIHQMERFSQTLLPAMAAVSAAAGSAAGAAARQMATSLFSNLLLSVMDGLLVPLVYAYTAACAAYAAVGNPGLKKVAALLKWVVTKSLTVLVMLFVTYLTLSGAIAGNADAAALKLTKTVLSGAVPVVGRIIADAAESVLVGAGMLKNAVGLFGMAVVLCICVTPFLRLGVHYLAYKVTGALAATLADSRLGELIDGIGTAFGLILGMTGAGTLFLLIGMAAGIAGGGT